MNLDFFKLGKYFSSKLVLQFYFVFFILINVLDFFNFLSGDVDFFKKILSWILIGFVFYKASFTKMFVGVVDRFCDWIFFLGFFLMGILKSIVHYVSISELDSFFVFNWLLSLVPVSEFFLTVSFLLGVLIIILNSIYILNKYVPTKNSLLGSFKFSEYFKFIGGEFLVLSLVSVFFGLIVFNFVMEWFALAVDSVILFLGLIYYLFMFLHHHTSVKISNLLSTISNTGNDFYQSLVLKFSDKKTFMIGVSFVLVLHLIVDALVYLVPFSTGLKNNLYGDFVIDSVPIFNFFEFSNSLFFIDVSQIYLENFISTVSIFLIYVFTILFFLILMISPFYYFYSNISNKKINLPSWIEVLFLVSFVSCFLVVIFPSLNLPISISIPDIGTQVTGVDLDVNSVLNLDSFYVDFLHFELILYLILMLVLFFEVKYVLKSSVNSFVKNKFIPIFVLLFFSIYIVMFFYSTVRYEVDSNFFSDRVINDLGDYDLIFSKFNSSLSDSSLKRIFVTSSAKTDFFSIEYSLFSDFEKNNFNGGEPDFLIVKLSDIDSSNSLTINDFDTRAIFEKDLDRVSDYFALGEFKFIYFIGNYGLNISQRGNGFVLDGDKVNFEITSIVDFSDSNKLTKFIEMIRIIFMSFFYVFGLFAFVFHFFKTNVLRS